MSQVNPKNDLIDSVKNPPTPLEYATKKAEKERSDVTKSLNSINSALEGIIGKEEKMSEASTKELQKKYKKQIKASKKYLEDLYATLKLEMYESAQAEYALERLV